MAVVILRLPRAQDRGERQAGGDEGHVGRLRMAVQVGDQHEGDHVGRADRYEQAQGIEHGRVDHRQEEDERQRAPGAVVDRHAYRDQRDHGQAPGDEERVGVAAAQQPLRPHQVNRERSRDPEPEQAHQEPPVVVVPGRQGVQRPGEA